MAGDNGSTISRQELEAWLWEAANILRGPVDPANLRDFVFPLLFLGRLSDAWDEEHERALARRHAFGEACGMDEATTARHILAGHPESVIADIRAFAAAGVDQLVAAAHAEQHASDIELIGQAALPALRAS